MFNAQETPSNQNFYSYSDSSTSNNSQKRKKSRKLFNHKLNPNYIHSNKNHNINNHIVSSNNQNKIRPIKHDNYCSLTHFYNNDNTKPNKNNIIKQSNETLTIFKALSISKSNYISSILGKIKRNINYIYV